jgi:diaminohydroxyphosphoribosylaminopyrimidine deaminase/5-amino-6-(5-phosphoribosylamino)uracil reductase
MENDENKDRNFMRMAIREAGKGVGMTRPNPPVGAVVVNADGTVLGRGYHHKAGGPHAEVNAVGDCGTADLSSATIYVTLEPCSTTGRTPPCTDLLIRRKFRRVVIGCTDPNPRHAGRGVGILRAAGIAVDVGVCEADCRELIVPFASTMLRRRPYLMLKLALTLDGKIADRCGTSKWITGAASRGHVQRLRGMADAILVGSGTVLADDPQLTCRLKDRAGGAWRVVVDSRGRLPAAARILTDDFAERTIVATTAIGAEALAERLPAPARPSIWVLPPGADGHADLAALLGRLTADLDVMEVLCEGGGELAGSLLRARLVDRLVLFYAPVVLGDATARSGFVGLDHLLAEGHLAVASRRVQTFGDDIALTFDLDVTSGKTT